MIILSSAVVCITVLSAVMVGGSMTIATKINGSSLPDDVSITTLYFTLLLINFGEQNSFVFIGRKIVDYGQMMANIKRIYRADIDY